MTYRDTLRRISGGLTVRRAERTGHVASALDIVLTLVMVGSASAAEANPFAQWFIAHGGLREWAVLTPVLVALGFGLVRVAPTSRVWKRAASWYFAGVVVLVAVRGVALLAVSGVPNVHWPWLAPAVAGVSVLAVLFATRWELGFILRRVGHRLAMSQNQRVAAGMAAVLVFAAVAPYAALAATSSSTAASTTTASGSGTLIDDFESGDFGPEWDSVEASWVVDKNQSFAGEYAAHFKDNDGGGDLASTSFDAPDSYWQTAAYLTGNVGTDQPDGDAWDVTITRSDTSTRVAQLAVEQDGDIVYTVNGSTNTVTSDVPRNEYLLYRITPDYGDDQVTLQILKSDGSVYWEKSNLDTAASLTTSASYDFQMTGRYEELFVDNPGVDQTTFTPDLTTRVTDQNGDPVRNATVAVVEYNKSAFTYSGQDELDRKIANLEANISDPTPPNTTWKPDRNVVSSLVKKNTFSDHFGDNFTVAVAHPRSAYGVLGTVGPDNQQVVGTASDAPRLEADHTLTPPASEDLVVTLWNYDSFSSADALTEDDINEDLPGKTTEGNITIERLDANGDPVKTFTAQTSHFVTTAFATIPTTSAGVGKNRHEAVVLSDPKPGFYRFYPEGHPDRGVVYAVSPDGAISKLEDEIVRGLKDEKGNLVARAQALEDAKTNNKLRVVNVTTNATGHATIDSIPSNYESVTVMAYKAPDGQDVTDPASVTQADIEGFVNGEIDSYEDEIRNLDTTADLDESSVLGGICQADVSGEVSGKPLVDRIGKAYAPSNPKQVDLPSSQTVGLTVQSVEAEQFADLENGACYGFQFAQFLRSNNFTNTLSWLLENADTVSRQRLEDVYKIAIDAARGSERMCRQLGDVIGEDPAGECEGGYSDDNNDGHWGDADGGGTNIPVTNETIENAARDTLENTTQAGAVVLNTVDSSDGLEECQRHIEDEDGQKAINIVWCSDRDIGDSHIHIRLDWSNGTTTYLTPNSSYVEIFDTTQPIDQDEIQLLEYPMGSDDPPSVSATAVVVGPGGGIGGSLPGGDDDGGGDGADTGSGGSGDVITAPSNGPIRNPTFSGEIPALNAVRVSTLRPGPDERVQVGVRPAEAAAFGTLEAVSVTGPDGQSISTANVTNSRNSAFTTNGSGVYRVAMTFSNAGGTNFTEVVRVRAGTVGHDLPPTLRMQQGATGRFAMVGGFDSGRLTVEQAGSRIEAVGILGAGSDVPPSVDIHTVAVDRANDATVTFRLVRGSTERAVQRSVTTRFHMSPISQDSGVLYRVAGSDDQPLPRSGENRFAAVDTNGSLTTATTYTEGDGTVAIQSVLDAGFIESTIYEFRVRFQSVPVVGSLVVIPVRVWHLVASLPLLGLGLVLTRRRWWE